MNMYNKEFEYEMKEQLTLWVLELVPNTDFDLRDVVPIQLWRDFNGKVRRLIGKFLSSLCNEGVLPIIKTEKTSSNRQLYKRI